MATSIELKEIADKLGIKPEDLVRVSIEELLTRPEETFQQAIDYVLKKNAELYRETEELRPIVDALFERWGIPKDMEPIPAEQLQRMMVECGIKPEDNVFSSAIIEMREE